MSWIEQVPWWAWTVVAILVMTTFNSGFSARRACLIFDELKKEVALLRKAVEELRTSAKRD